MDSPPTQRKIQNTTRIIRELFIGVICIAEALVIPASLRTEDHLAPLHKAISDDKRPETYLVTLFEDADYHEHFKRIGRDLEADNSTGFEWFEYADSYYATNITDDWVRPFPKLSEHRRLSQRSDVDV
jgi:hypothetical protein